MAAEAREEVAVFGGGCFWCTEAVFQELRGVHAAEPGYAGGKTENPDYESVSAGQTGHAEVIKIVFDPGQISYRELLKIFFATHDPTTKNRQGNDIGPQYRSVIFYASETQRQEAEQFIAELKRTGTPVLTALEPLTVVYPAEDYHRHYYQTHRNEPYCQVVIAPKLEKLKKLL